MIGLLILVTIHIILVAVGIILTVIDYYKEYGFAIDLFALTTFFIGFSIMCLLFLWS